MSGATFILFINLAIAGLFCAAFVLIAAHERTSVAPRWFAATYALGVANLGFEASLPHLADARLGAFLAYASFQGALLCLNIGLAERYRVTPPRTLLAAALAISLVVGALVQDMPRDSIERMFLYQFPYFLMQATGAAIVFKAHGRRIADTVLGWFLGVSALHYLAKPFLALSFGGTGASSQAYLASDYAMFSQAMGTVLVVATALLLLALLIGDILGKAIARSETDALSGLLNRGGFEQRLNLLLRGRLPGGLTLVIADLDHFKRVNDTHGHAIGDRLIELFARTLSDQAAEHHLLGRIGGEEFAIVLPGAGHVAGRLFAEGARTAYAARAAQGRFGIAGATASFGVAEMMPGESTDALFARADAALYEAKRGGRDRVRVNLADSAVGGSFGMAS